MHIDMAAIDMLLGNLDESLGHAHAAIACAKESGHVRTNVAAMINIGQVLEWMGDFAGARKYLSDAVDLAGGNKLLIRDALDSQANLLISAGELDRCHAFFREHTQFPLQRPDQQLYWDSLTETLTRARLASAECDWGRRIWATVASL